MRFQERYHGAQRRARIFRLSISTVDLTWLDGEVFQSLETEKRQKVLQQFGGVKFVGEKKGLN